jgi:hypothetical protein
MTKNNETNRHQYSVSVDNHPLYRGSCYLAARDQYYGARRGFRVTMRYGATLLKERNILCHYKDESRAAFGYND